jgi:(4S)-4-hydroxy-5-phosphonooxypentane-2,3-dione isomerase
MYGILFRVEAKHGKFEELCKFLEWDAEVARDKEPGTLRFEFYRDGNKDALFVYEAYRDRSAFEEHKKNEPFHRWSRFVCNDLCVDFKKLFDGDAVSKWSGSWF